MDIRDKVEKERDLLKKIELAIPGFRGYRKREDLRIADSLLRKQVADRLQYVRIKIESCKTKLAKKMEMDVLEDMAKIVNAIQTAENKVSHLEQGYTGISANYRIEEEELNRMYEWDLSLLDNIKNLERSVVTLDSLIDADKVSETKSEIHVIDNEIKVFMSTFSSRREKIANIEVGGE